MEPRPETGTAPPNDLGTEVRALTGESQRVARLCLSTLAFLGAGSLLGVASSLYLVNHYPLLLVALSPIGRHMILVAPIVDPFAFVAVLVTRRMLFYLACFHLGRALGARGVEWIESRAARFGRFVRWLEQLFERWSHGVVLLMAGPTTSVLAGISGMRAWVWASLAVASLVLRSLAVLAFGEWMREPIKALLALVDEYWVPGTVLLVAGIGAHRWWRTRRGRSRGVSTSIQSSSWSRR